MQAELAGVSLSDLTLYLLKRKETAVYPALSLPKQGVRTLNWVHICLGIWKKSKRLIVLMNSQAENSILSQVDILVIKHALLSLLIGRIATVVNQIREQYLTNGPTGGKDRRLGGLLLNLLIQGLKIVLQQLGTLLLVILLGVIPLPDIGNERLHIVPRERPGQNVNKLKHRLKGLVNKMRQVVLNLLRPLYVGNPMKLPSNPVDFLRLGGLKVLRLLQLQLHVPAYTARIWVLLHVVVHLVDGVLVGAQAGVQQDGVFRVQDLLVAETVEEPVVRG